MSQSFWIVTRRNNQQVIDGQWVIAAAHDEEAITIAGARHGTHDDHGGYAAEPADAGFDREETLTEEPISPPCPDCGTPHTADHQCEPLHWTYTNANDSKAKP